MGGEGICDDEVRLEWETKKFVRRQQHETRRVPKREELRGREYYVEEKPWIVAY